MAISEAMASGCAVVTTPTGFGLDLEDGKEGILCNFQDVDAMEAAIERLLDEDSMRIPMAHAGWKKVQSLRWEKSISDLEESYLRWLSMPRRK